MSPVQQLPLAARMFVRGEHSVYGCQVSEDVQALIVVLVWQGPAGSARAPGPAGCVVHASVQNHEAFQPFQDANLLDAVFE